MAIMTITWVTALDDLVCPVCKPLHNHTWTFNTHEHPFPNTLTSPVTRLPVWDCIRDKSLSHLQLINRGEGIKCRCTVKASFNVSNITAKLQQLHDELKVASQEG
jgi:hypothetical protein